MLNSDPSQCLSSQELCDVLDVFGHKNGIKSRRSKRLPSDIAAEISLSPEKSISATIRDISGTGMGFQHREPLGLQEVGVTVQFGGEALRVRIVVVWCQKGENGLFMSGGHYPLGRRNSNELAS